MADQPSESATNMQARQKKRSSAQKKESETKEAATAATAMKRQRVEEHTAEHGKNACNHTYILLLFSLHFVSSDELFRKNQCKCANLIRTFSHRKYTTARIYAHKHICTH